jgi:hypothetical protein
MVRTAAGLPAREVEVKLRPQIRGTDLKVVGFNIGAQVARGSTVPAGRVFLAGGDSARIINPPTGGLGSKTPESRTLTTWLEAVVAVLHGQAGPAHYSIPITQ